MFADAMSPQDARRFFRVASVVFGAGVCVGWMPLLPFGPAEYDSVGQLVLTGFALYVVVGSVLATTWIRRSASTFSETHVLALQGAASGAVIVVIPFLFIVLATRPSRDGLAAAIALSLFGAFYGLIQGRIIVPFARRAHAAAMRGFSPDAAADHRLRTGRMIVIGTLSGNAFWMTLMALTTGLKAVMYTTPVARAFALVALVWGVFVWRRASVARARQHALLAQLRAGTHPQFVLRPVGSVTVPELRELPRLTQSESPPCELVVERATVGYRDAPKVIGAL